ncbi:hypothetical protein ARC20_05905 [Stenotrophomonas panacihumi]|uniref:DUF4166 domain-containing protein n=1 Tax=Stenotrophomonas panacihumi TaxID=676599 RepID=A0A0R0AM20_9GAMM|nr:DUF4166 domain-containing protein [Stenotrophomonas panacihumi]KRG46255.1 hypothetical protein ARC20_05905 [Stenotrophomonas panacihumi]PTN54839.1 DUF4166 domain-containing protein [Stenotrophomonas panacihumi]
MTPLFARVLGPRFEALAPRVRELHSIPARQTWSGVARITRGRHPLVAPCAWLARLPPTADSVPVQVEFVVDARGEQWLRQFGTHRMPSRLWDEGGLLRERLGALRFEFDLREDAGQIHWRVHRVWAFGVVPLPVRWFGQVRCREREHAGRYEFLVDVAMPLMGPFMTYEGWLEPR